VGRFTDALSRPGLAAIAEFKRRSPSAGDIRPDARVEEIVPAYARARAAAISVLVDEQFAGTLDDLRAARTITDTPLLAKGFFRTEEQLAELKYAGADAALLILRDLDDKLTRRLMHRASALGLDTLVEAHDAEELRRAARLDAPVIGVNARDLSTFAIDRHAQLALVAQAPRDKIVIAESAIQTRAQGAAAELAGADAILVGTTLMQATDPGSKLDALVSRPLVKICGMTNQDDVDAALDAGADLIGFILAEASPRRAEAVLDVPQTALSVAVFVGEPQETHADLVQLYDHEPGTVRGRDAVLLREGERVADVLDLPWGQEDASHLDRAQDAEGRVVLAGKLDASNVGGAIKAVRPWGVDAVSRLERAPGIKDHEKVRAFVEAARAAVS
jgi:indole-3-glycerol phosphate synthase/phosphoribosylanthranilate isomerase